MISFNKKLYLYKFNFVLLGLFFAFFVSRSYAFDKAHNLTAKPSIFFDLGNTLINTTNLKELKYFPNAKSHVEELKKSGYRVGLMTNIPEKWGTTYSEKIATLKKFIKANWVGETEFDWSIFDHILIPLKDEQRKPARHLYDLARSVSSNCPIVYISENPKEVVMAQAMGFVSYNVMDNMYSDKNYFSPINISYIPVKALSMRIQDAFDYGHHYSCFDQVTY